ncbi:MAG: acyltransferase [Ignavibacteriae bacterium]|nr:acyltransferase [Ignavibacteriota bacterium]
MGIGIRKSFFKIYSVLKVTEFGVRKYLFGFETANQMVSRFDKITLVKVLKKYGATIGDGCDIECGLTFHNCFDYIGLKVGANVHIGKNCFFDLADEVRIESNVVVSMNTSFITHINMKKSQLEKIFKPKTEKLIIGKNTYVGANCCLLMGVELGENCFVAAGSVVTKSFNSDSFIAGVPAVLKRMITK